MSESRARAQRSNNRWVTTAIGCTSSSRRLPSGSRSSITRSRCSRAKARSASSRRPTASRQRCSRTCRTRRRTFCDHLSDFRGGAEPLLQLGIAVRPPDHARFRVNVFVDHTTTDGSPGRRRAQSDLLQPAGQDRVPRDRSARWSTDFREIKPGALHRANGGFLVLEALDVLRHPFSWEALKRALRASEARIENLGEEFSAGAEREPASRADPARREGRSCSARRTLYQPPATSSTRTFASSSRSRPTSRQSSTGPREHQRNYAAFVSRCVRENGLRHFDRAAVARVVEYGARLRESQHKLSMRLLDVSDVVSEASFWAERSGHPLVEAGDVELARAQEGVPLEPARGARSRS